ncbi:MAG: nucleotidyltransferase family protein [Kiritimatiellae bacterium]|nr:nucleotidyltransferase family protein [Kiritimatiellia bacterium]
MIREPETAAEPAPTRQAAAALPKCMTATLASAADSIQEIIRKMDWAAMEIILIVDAEGALLGTITDGDIRRGILAGVDLGEPAERIMNRKPVTVPLGTPAGEMLQVMRKFSIRHLPVVDGRNRPVRLELLQALVDDIREQKAVIMAGGLGTRLHPLTDSTPKPMLPIAGRPLLDRILHNLRANGVEDVAISVHHLADRIRAHIGDGNDHQVRVSYINEKKRLGTAGGLSLLDPRPKRPFIVMNGDLLTTINFASLLRFHRKAACDLVMCVRKQKVQVPYGVVELDGERIVSLHEKPVYEHFINAGIYVLEPACIDLIPRERYFDMTDLVQTVLEAGGRVCAFPVIEYWRDIGNPEDLRAAIREQLNIEAALKLIHPIGNDRPATEARR